MINQIAKTILTLFVLLLLTPCTASLSHADEYDVVIYGGTSGGLAAAIQVKRMGKSVVVLEPSNRIGGLTTGGLGQTDIGNKAAVGGISREFYQRIKQYYDPAHVDARKWQKPTDYRSRKQTRTGPTEDTMWTFEPSAALKVYTNWIAEDQIKLLTGMRLDRTAGVTTKQGRITSIAMENGDQFSGRIFIDATYEGDLMAAANVSYLVGRESNSTYAETLNGIQTRQAKHHQFVPHVDPYIQPGNPASGLLPFIDPTGPGPEGDGDNRVQAYCFRMCMTDHPENKIPWSKPEGYTAAWYELMLRNFDAGADVVPLNIGLMPNRKTDANNNRGFSTDFIGQNHDYPEASYQRREEIVNRHRLYQQGLMWTLANHPRVPEKIRQEISRWGLCRDEFERGDGWQQQIYVREARRMIGKVVMTQHHCQGRQVAEHPIGLAAYTMDSHHVQRHLTSDGFVRNEGDVQVGGFSPYPIDYGSIVPQANECENLLVPVCLSASHIAFGSIRMEPVFMVLGQSAGTAACLAIEHDTSVQQVDYARLRAQLLQDQQHLEWTGARRTTYVPIDLEKLAGVTVDDSQAELTGFENSSTATGPWVGRDYHHDGNTDKGQQLARFQPTLPADGEYDVRMYYSPHDNRASNVPVRIQSIEGWKTVSVNQQKRSEKGYIHLGRFAFLKGNQAVVEISNTDTDGYVIVDAIQFVPAG